MTISTTPGWHPEGEDGVERWWDGEAWTEHRRRSRYPYYVERNGKLTYTGKRFFPAGSDDYLRLTRQTQWLSAIALALLLLLVVLLIPLVVYALPVLFLLAIIVLGVLIAALFPAIGAAQAGRQIRDQYLRNELYVPVGADGLPLTSVQPAPPNWPTGTPAASPTP